MVVIHDANLLSMVFRLMDRGLSATQIDRAMKQVIGRDWREVGVSVWLERLKSQGYPLQNDRELTVNDVEALVKGRMKLDDLGKGTER